MFIQLQVEGFEGLHRFNILNLTYWPLPTAEQGFEKARAVVRLSDGAEFRVLETVKDIDRMVYGQLNRSKKRTGG